MGTGGKKARAVDHIGAPFDQRLQQHRVLGRIVFEIGILNDDEVARSLFYAAVQGSTFAHVLGLQQNSNLGMLRLQLRQDFA